MAQPNSSPTTSRRGRWPWTGWATLFVVALVAAVRILAMNFPLERDEGEYAYAGQLILQGIPPYELAYNMKFPGTYAAYALIMALFGQTPAGIHFGVMCVTSLTALMLYGLGKRILDDLFGMVAATTYIVLATESSMFGLEGHATHFGALFVTAGASLLWRARERPHWLVAGFAGVMFGMAVLTKQHAAVIAFWAMAMLAWDCFRKAPPSSPSRWTNLISAGAGTVLPFAVCCLIFWQLGIFGKFWFWTISYAREYVSVLPFSVAGHRLWWTLCSMASEDYLLWILVLAGFVLLWREERLKPVGGWLAGFVFCAGLSTVPGFYFRTHYFLLVLPAAALLAAGAVAGLRRLAEGRFAGVPWLVPGGYLVLLTATLVQNRGVWAMFTAAQGEYALRAHEFYGPEPFPEAPVISDFIRAHSKPSDTIAILGSEPEIYFLSRRHSATGYLYMYPLMEPQAFASRMQEEMIREVETNAPPFVVVVRMNSSWFARANSDKRIFEWWSSYQTNYTYVGCADMISPSDIRYVLGRDNVTQYHRDPTNGLIVYQRNP